MAITNTLSEIGKMSLHDGRVGRKGCVSGVVGAKMWLYAVSQETCESESALNSV